MCEWLGHTEAVAKKHYWQVTDDDYRRAAGLRSDRGIGPNGEALQIALQTSDAKPCNAMNDEISPQVASHDDAPDCINQHRNARYLTNVQVTPTGFEPVLQA